MLSIHSNLSVQTILLDLLAQLCFWLNSRYYCVIINLIVSSVLLYTTEACRLLSHNKQSFDFAVTRIFVKICHTGSSAVVKGCQFNFDFLPIQSQINIRTASFLKKFIVYENSLCCSFEANAACQLSEIATDVE